MSLAGAAAMTARRKQVAGLWLRGASAEQIAEALKCSEATVRRDLRSIEEELAAITRASFEAERNRSLAVYRLVQQRAWGLFAHAEEHAGHKLGELNAVLQAEDRIARISGVLGADVQVMAVAMQRMENDDIERAAVDSTVAELSTALLSRISGPGARDAGGAGVRRESGTVGVRRAPTPAE